MFRPARKLQTNARSLSSTDPVPAALIQRLIILHDGLMPLPKSKTQPQSQIRRNPQLSEAASLEEHGEFILYYYDHSLHFPRGCQPHTASASRSRNDSETSNPSAREENPPCRHATEEAVRFSGVCRALRSLPSALQPEKHNNEREENVIRPEEQLSETDVVHLQDSTLVFVSLELRGDIVAVAQIPRACKSPFRSKGFGADPSAMKAALRHIHASFSLFFGGGIHRRLLHTKLAESSKDWVFEVNADIQEDDEMSTSGISVSSKVSLKLVDDPFWEVTDKDKVEPEKKALKKNIRRRSKKMKRLSSSITAGSSMNSSITDGNQINAHSLEDSVFVNYRYGGMMELFSLRREHRKLSNRIMEGTPRIGRSGALGRATWVSSSNAADLFNDVADDVGHNDWKRRIKNLLKILPITRLREDLVVFYDEWLLKMQGVSEMIQGGVGRCVVDMVPSPICQDRKVRGQHLPISPAPFVCLAAGELIKSLPLLLDERRHSRGQINGRRQSKYMHEELEGGRLFGMILFYQNRLVLSEAFDLQQSTTVFPPEIAQMIARRFCSSKKGQMKTEKASVKHDNERDLPRWMSTVSMGGANNNVKAQTCTSSAPFDGINKECGNGDNTVGYMTCSPSSSGYTGPVESLLVNNRHVWFQHLYLPMPNNDEVETYAAFFEKQEFSFILIFKLKSTRHDHGALAQMAEELTPKAKQVEKGRNKPISRETLAFTDMLTFLADKLTEFCKTYSSHQGIPKDIASNKMFHGEPGMDLIFIDRDQNTFVLLSQHDLSSTELKCIGPPRPGTSDSKQKIGFFDMFSKPKETNNQKILRHPIQCTNMVDCRHKLAAYLPLDVMLALDDMFNEIGRVSYRQNILTFPFVEANAHANDDTSTNKSMELCTFLPQGWVYGRAFGNVELYIILDTKKFVTINDVQKTVTRVREKMFNDRFR